VDEETDVFSQLFFCYCALRFPQGKDPCGIPQGHRQFSLWDFFPQGTFVHFKDPCGIL
jgi:hypothetical protein